MARSHTSAWSPLPLHDQRYLVRESDHTTIVGAIVVRVAPCVGYLDEQSVSIRQIEA